MDHFIDDIQHSKSPAIMSGRAFIHKDIIMSTETGQQFNYLSGLNENNENIVALGSTRISKSDQIMIVTGTQSDE